MTSSLLTTLELIDKAGPDNEERDAHGRWTAGGGSGRWAVSSKAAVASSDFAEAAGTYQAHAAAAKAHTNAAKVRSFAIHRALDANDEAAVVEHTAAFKEHVAKAGYHEKKAAELKTLSQVKRKEDKLPKGLLTGLGLIGIAGATLGLDALSRKPRKPPVATVVDTPMPKPVLPLRPHGYGRGPRGATGGPKAPTKPGGQFKPRAGYGRGPRKPPKQ